MKVVFNQTNLEREEKTWQQLIERLSQNEGCLFACDYTYPGRYHPWQVGLEQPILKIRAWGRYFEIEVINNEYEQVLAEIYEYIYKLDYLEMIKKGRSELSGKALILGQISLPSHEVLTDENLRTHQNSIFTLIKSILKVFETDCDVFGLYGGFGYSLVHQFEELNQGINGLCEDPNLTLYLPSQLLLKSNEYEQTKVITYNFLSVAMMTNSYFNEKLKSRGENNRDNIKNIYEPNRGQAVDQYKELVNQLKPLFKRGELFEAVPSYEILHKEKHKSSELFSALRKLNPSPFHYFINMGKEQLIGASPEMYVRVTGNLVETCPISGTIPRGTDSLSDHNQIRTLLNSKKDEDELTMCTDVDRNDKSKVCDPSTIKVIGRRQVELYSHLIHTVDHVTGKLRPGKDSIDAFIAHMWAVTVTGAPKKAAMNWIEDNEATPRRWYGGAVGYFTAKGDINTGLTLRGIQVRENLSSVRVGATILYDSDPQMEALETIVKAAAMEKVMGPAKDTSTSNCSRDSLITSDKQKLLEVLLIDHDDSFVHTLGGYFERNGCQVRTLRQSNVGSYFTGTERPDLMVLSPGPGTPDDFKLHESIKWAVERKIPIFGVCLGLQGIATYFGGTLGQLELPMHGKSSELKAIKAVGEVIPHKQLFSLEEQNISPKVGRYHSLYALDLPENLVCYAITEDHCPMAIYHRELPIWAVQFHPESIMSAENDFGGKIIEALIQKIRSRLYEVC